MLEKRLLTLKTRFSDVKTEKTHLKSIVSSRASSYLVELESLKQGKRQRKKSQAHLQSGKDTRDSVTSPMVSITAASNLLNSTFFTRAAVTRPDAESPTPEMEEDSDEEDDVEIDILEREVDALKQQHKTALRDSKALLEGTSVWKSVCSSLSSLEQSIIQICATPPPSSSGAAAEIKEKQANDIEKLLGQTIQRLETLLRVVNNENWGLLVVAISHELGALYQSQNMILGDDDQEEPDQTNYRKTRGPLEENSNGGRHEQSPGFIRSDNEDDDENYDNETISDKKHE